MKIYYQMIQGEHNEENLSPHESWEENGLHLNHLEEMKFTPKSLGGKVVYI